MSNSQNDNHLLAVDVGGTKTRFGIFDLVDHVGEAHITATYLNSQFSDFEEVVARFLAEYVVTVKFACIGMAGVVDNDQGVMTNLPWHIAANQLIERFAFTDIRLINDLTALAEVVPLLQEQDVVAVQEGKCYADHPAAVIAPGTGLGQGFVLVDDKRIYAKGSEGGHSGFSPGNAKELALLQWMMKNSGPVSVEQVAAGPAIPLLFEFVMEKQGLKAARWVREKIKQTGESTAVIVEGAGTGQDKCPVCSKAIELFLGILGGEAANLVLKLYARGGVYIGGGVIGSMVGKVSFAPFLQGFMRNGMMEELLATIPVKIIVKNDVQLYGAASYGARVFRSSGP